MRGTYIKSRIFVIVSDFCSVSISSTAFVKAWNSTKIRRLPIIQVSLETLLRSIVISWFHVSFGIAIEFRGDLITWGGGGDGDKKEWAERGNKEEKEVEGRVIKRVKYVSFISSVQSPDLRICLRFLPPRLNNFTLPFNFPLWNPIIFGRWRGSKGNEKVSRDQNFISSFVMMFEHYVSRFTASRRRLRITRARFIGTR